MYNYISSFMEKNQYKINKAAYKLYNSQSPVAQQAYWTIINDNLNKAYSTFIENNNTYKQEEIDNYLFGTIHRTYKQINQQGKQKTLICPGCRFNSKISFLTETSDSLICEACSSNHINSIDEKVKEFSRIFSNHSKSGFACGFCNNFIPLSAKESKNCPYPNCLFSWENEEFVKVQHPFIRTNQSSLQFPVEESKTKSILCKENKQLNSLISNEIFDKIYNIIESTLNKEINLVHLYGSISTEKIRISILKAYLEILRQEPDLMIEYLSVLGRNNKQAGIQVKIFQEFIKILESNIPYIYETSNKKIEISSLLSRHLKIFDGESSFIAPVIENSIRNTTQEKWKSIKSSGPEIPYYIGKLLSIKNHKTGEELINFVKSYSCLEIKLDDICPLVNEVEVKHLRIIPHYCSGGFSYIQRMKKRLVAKIIPKIKNEIK